MPRQCAREVRVAGPRHRNACHRRGGQAEIVVDEQHRSVLDAERQQTDELTPRSASTVHRDRLAPFAGIEQIAPQVAQATASEQHEHRIDHEYRSGTDGLSGQEGNDQHQQTCRQGAALDKLREQPPVRRSHHPAIDAQGMKHNDGDEWQQHEHVPAGVKIAVGSIKPQGVCAPQCHDTDQRIDRHAERPLAAPTNARKLSHRAIDTRREYDH